MPPLPQECQALAAEIAALGTSDQNLRAQLATLVGAEAWAALAQLGQTRSDLSQKQAQLNTCIRNHSAAFQANLVVMDLKSDGAPQPTRVAHLWEIAPTGTVQRDASAVSSNAFSFAGPLPAQLGISVMTTGVADVVGPDFRSPPIAASALTGPGPVRIEVVLGPQVRIEAADLSRLIASAFTPMSNQVELPGASANVSIVTADAKLLAGGIIGSVNGQIEIRDPLGSISRLPFSGSATLSLVPSAVPGSIDLCDVITVIDPVVDVPGLSGTLLSAILAAVRGWVSEVLTNQLRQIVRRELPAAVAMTFVLSNLPTDVTVSVRRLQIDPSAITFQPALGAFGTTLSTFHSPVIPPP